MLNLKEFIVVLTMIALVRGTIQNDNNNFERELLRTKRHPFSAAGMNFGSFPMLPDNRALPLGFHGGKLNGGTFAGSSTGGWIGDGHWGGFGLPGISVSEGLTRGIPFGGLPFGGIPFGGMPFGGSPGVPIHEGVTRGIPSVASASTSVSEGLTRGIHHIGSTGVSVSKTQTGGSPVFGGIPFRGIPFRGSPGVPIHEGVTRGIPSVASASTPVSKGLTRGIHHVGSTGVSVSKTQMGGPPVFYHGKSLTGGYPGVSVGGRKVENKHKGHSTSAVASAGSAADKWDLAAFVYPHLPAFKIIEPVIIL